MVNETIDISIIIPAMNEKKRLPEFLDRLLSFIQTDDHIYEVLVVDDGSTDKTAECAEGKFLNHPQCRVLSLDKNHGKGFAVRHGFSQAKGNVLVFMDADGSTAPQEIVRLLPLLTQGCDCVIGSRLRVAEVTLETRFFRRLLGKFFQLCVRRILRLPFKDTQCGFKMFKRESIQPLLSSLSVDGFSFDLEILTLLTHKGAEIKEVPVNWSHKDGSKVNLLSEPFKMILNMLRLRKRFGRNSIL